MQQKTSLDRIKNIMLIVFISLMSITIASCSSDDDDSTPDINDYYVEFNFSGGGLNSQQLSTITSAFNIQYGDELSWDNISSKQAIYYFDRIVEGVRNDFTDGSSVVVSGTLNITLTLKTKSGKTIKKEVVRVSRTGVE